eukprot:TRINITY_DN11221_c0_g2_i1.p1 TRINITY_DN11221_c0_g2~~TRINITY_DN11221_c0_g2_i1.p1  ORF type:complete len:102 (+),score=6.31 TRINITY_DN11221_c0_g2_i1:1127-1432(+)
MKEETKRNKKEEEPKFQLLLEHSYECYLGSSQPLTIELCILTPHIKHISSLSQIKTHLTLFKSNEHKYIMKIDVLVEIHMVVPSCTGFNKIRENPFLRKSP